MTTKTSKMPVIFIGHGSPMNALADNAFTNSLKEVSRRIETPTAILVVSAHWITNGVELQGGKNPKTIHDFGGFPQALFDIQYPAKGVPELARELELLKVGKVTEDWGLDHGAWTILRHIYPQADIPVFQMSLNANMTFKEHFELAKEIKFLRERGVLIIGSGNIVHNLRQINWKEDSAPFEWAIEFDELIKESIVKRNYSPIINILSENPTLAKTAHPTFEHFVPLLYTLGASSEKDELSSIFEGIQNASISMRSFILG